MENYNTEDCISYMSIKHSHLSKEIKAVIDALEENATAIYDLDLVDEEYFMKTFLEQNYKLDKETIQIIIQSYYDYINSL